MQSGMNDDEREWQKNGNDVCKGVGNNEGGSEREQIMVKY